MLKIMHNPITNQEGLVETQDQRRGDTKGHILSIYRGNLKSAHSQR
jgi:hypothetical protein